MITTADLAKSFDDQLIQKAACPICLSKLFHSSRGNEYDQLICSACESSFYVLSGLPVFLVQDENQQMKEDEIKGELEYNVKKIPMEVHEQRNAFVNSNTQLFLDEYKENLTDKEILIVGCSMAEVEFYSTMTDRIMCLDIGPTLANACRQACNDRGIKAAWICGDGECLPLDRECFDAVVVRQSLHHMLKYYSAISEFFRVCRIGGTIMILDEPFAPLNPQNVAMDWLDNETVYGNITFGQIRESARISRRTPPANIPSVDFAVLEKERKYIAPDSTDPESWLADKYHDFSLLNCIYALRLHTVDVYLSWPKEVAWTDASGDTVRFCHGLNPHYSASLEEKLVRPGNVSIAARKLKESTLVRRRRGLQAISLEALRSLDPSLEIWSAT